MPPMSAYGNKLLSANIWITDMAHFAVDAKLASPDYKIEIMVAAAR